ncbi:MAG: BppU family phage baseplate upper protein [Clostridium perfringens]|nr:BppU family phage baseplate upper protein [Clostridium perfringens]
MSEIGLNINVDSYNNEGIKTIKGNNNAEIYKLYILKNKRRLNLVGKTVKLGYVMAGATKGDIIEDLNITNAEQGEITLPITNIISKQDGVYSCQLAIYGADEFLEYTATFGLTVKANIFTKIAGEIENSKDLTYIERILEEATNISEELKSNIPVARQLNSDLENQNRILNENMDRANGVNNTLITTTEQSKVAATDAIEKKSQLESSITKAKEFIDGLDGSQDIPGMRMELTELQNGLKSNQSLEYSGSSITANDTLEGRTEGMKIKGRTLNNLYKANNIREDAGGKYILVDTLVKDEPKDRVVYIVNNTNRILLLNVYKINGGWDSNPIIRENSISKLDLTGKKLTGFLGMYDRGWTNSEADKELLRNTCIVLDREETYIPQKYFEGLKSFGEAEQEGDKYKITILSYGKNLCDFQKSKLHGSLNAYITEKNGEFSYSVGIDDKVGWFAETDNIKIHEGNYTISIEVKANLSSGAQKFWYGVYLYDVNGTYLGYRGTYVDTTNNYNRYNLPVDIPPNTSFCKFRVYNYSNIAGTITFKNPQLEEGTVATLYEPYKSDKKDILISAPLPGFYFGEDIMYEENGQVKVTRNIDNYIFTGDETIRDTTEQDEKSGTGKYKVFVLTINKTIDKNKNINNNFPKKQFSVAFQKVDSEGLAITQYGVYIKILKSKLSTQDAEGLKAWLKANKTTIYFARDTPVTEIVENCVDIDLDTYQEKTYFNILNSLPGTLDFKVPSNIGSVVQNMAKEVNNIWDVINNLLVPGLIDVNKTVAMATIKNNLQ